MKWLKTAPLLVALTGCGAIAENVAENVVERAIEQSAQSETGVEANVDIDTSDGSMVFNVETPDGEQQMVFGGGQIPDGFPVPIPSGAAVQAVISAGAEGSMVTVSLPADDFDSARALYTDFFADFDDTTTVDGPDQLTWTSQSGGASVILSKGSDEAIVTIIASP